MIKKTSGILFFLGFLIVLFILLPPFEARSNQVALSGGIAEYSEGGQTHLFLINIDGAYVLEVNDPATYQDLVAVAGRPAADVRVTIFGLPENRNGQTFLEVKRLDVQHYR